MSNSATAPTSTTASSPSSASDARAPRLAATNPYRAAAGHETPAPDGSSAPAGTAPVEIVACGALAGHIREIAARRGWPVIVRPLPAALHNRPEQIKGHAERELATAQASNSRALIAYADCGSYGALDELSTKAGLPRLPGLHCYDLYAGEARIAQLFAEEPGTYLLTDYLIRSFDRSVIKPLGLDRHPELWADYFSHYKRLIWLVQRATPELEEAAIRIAGQFSLPLTRIDTGTTGLEAALAPLIETPERPEKP